jgi:hypothetical protein
MRRRSCQRAIAAAATALVGSSTGTATDPSRPRTGAARRLRKGISRAWETLGQQAGMSDRDLGGGLASDSDADPADHPRVVLVSSSQIRNSVPGSVGSSSWSASSSSRLVAWATGAIIPT